MMGGVGPITTDCNMSDALNIAETVYEVYYGFVFTYILCGVTSDTVCIKCFVVYHLLVHLL